MSIPISWTSVHVLCVLGHLGMMMANMVAFVATDVNMKEDFDISTQIHVTPWGAGAVATFALFCNLVLLGAVHTLENPKQHKTVENRDSKRQMAVVVGICFNACFVAAESAMAYYLASASGMLEHSSTGPLNFACFMAAVSAITTSATVGVDALKLREWRNETHGDRLLVEETDLLVMNSEVDDEEGYKW
ncbi:hypothetical protein SLS58_006381 [Diplodia intermedia]|uniref:Transmembrane protein n=1 Tax=Diplodia intermedia TaxID=856260 RepID=A0ABR3TNL3_9PEZI